MGIVSNNVNTGAIIGDIYRYSTTINSKIVPQISDNAYDMYVLASAFHHKVL